jgi:DNA-binding winged helix-turn-helix (wHTH) protein
MFRFGEYTLDVVCGCLRTADREIELRPKSFEVLRYLVENAGRLVTKDELIKTAWRNVVVTDESLMQCVSEVRHAIADDGQTIIKTVPRRGYRFVAPVLRVAAGLRRHQRSRWPGRHQPHPIPPHDRNHQLIGPR